MVQLEICASSVVSARAAHEGGARRIELCRDLSCGGLTPSDDEIAYCVQTLGLRTHVLVRPRPGDFCYSSDEQAAIAATIRRCRALGATAVVVGFLTSDGRIDVELTRRMVQEAEGMEVTFHRAFDEARQEPLEALRAVAAAGCHRLLTSGQCATALEGRDTIRRLVGATPVTILAGSGVVADNVRTLVADTGVGEVHASCKMRQASGTVETDAAQVRALLEQLQNIS